MRKYGTYCMRTPANSHERINNEQECIYLCWPQSNASPSANDMSTKLYLNTLCQGFCTSVLFIVLAIIIFKRPSLVM